MRYKYLIISVYLLLGYQANSQNLPHIMTQQELQEMPVYLNSRSASPQGITTPPVSPVRTIAEWEELQGLVITWTSYYSILAEIVRAAKQETRVYLICSNTASAQNYLSALNIDTVNVTFVNASFNSVWSRDYGPWSAYTNNVDTLITVDWIYNRPRPLDDVVPGVIANIIGTPLYETTQAPYNLIHTGGNFMTDGAGTGFSSNLILNENSGKTEAQIDSIMELFMGINRYIKMSTLPYDVIHHIDMHMKLLDEETILMGEYPAGVADGPQIEANLLYVINNYNSIYGSPYKVIRIPMPPDNGQYPSNNGDYFTYTNSSFINKTIIVPTYNISQDTTALRIYKDALPGYNVVGINSLQSISALGALHCITKELGTSDPMLIRHQPLPDTYDQINPYTVSAYMEHRSGIATATLYWRTDTLLPYTSLMMTQGFNPAYWLADIPAQVAGTVIYYYVEGNAVSGKTQVRPISAPDGYWKFRVLSVTALNESGPVELQMAFPNPSKGITCLPVTVKYPTQLSVSIYDIEGKKVKEIFNNYVAPGVKNCFVNTQSFLPGVYFFVVQTDHGKHYQKLIVK